ncbi:ATP synthase F0 subunit B [Candidatus Desulfovibrio trichonymphae]|uniref:ATP synthase subunit b n=1 Tax=Candidatus Desulfovibrio trichonymphae TaxID=1725232 RepID=A0A1J1DX58_9BACT|nr:ATP synthase F0 subunit B [Candidatus Desulfovibrio trichonymphae]BAV91678.1 F0F1 ATP synthase subunit B' [Candidatus Desulfovibrio trichonymphae]GHU91169.1 ATP synthase F0 subunit B' [Deltaproteobacteria bacterium]GHU94871.1 ATP synthase F0 subunit B' [Deltaproteobacteria bacterium]
MLDLNITLLFQLVNFFVAVFVLNILLIRPIRDIIKKRNDVIDGMAGEADNFESEAAQRLSAYEEELARARQAAGLARKEGRAGGAAEQQKIVGAAQQSARGILDEARRTVQAEAEATLKDLRARTAAVSAQLVDRLLKG